MLVNVASEWKQCVAEASRQRRPRIVRRGAAWARCKGDECTRLAAGGADAAGAADGGRAEARV
eukprot:scaffold412_cov388-Prasinococcus_capsulatus_cf.AAC.43